MSVTDGRGESWAEHQGVHTHHQANDAPLKCASRVNLREADQHTERPDDEAPREPRPAPRHTALSCGDEGGEAIRKPAHHPQHPQGQDGAKVFKNHVLESSRVFTVSAVALSFCRKVVVSRTRHNTQREPLCTPRHLHTSLPHSLID
ncbi:hypothetical protein E2C01_024436 [Portunus trituberculatus]|uniref:Uncharacterized protein n=1 Tax=Portunus trituberculatus TaxID=210409 RepID=A0A5B7ECT9_PORTR|nr:hypothetical protein [Portunus trituberculatus]